MDKPTLIVPDTHGHLDRVQALLEQEGIIKDDKRINHDVEVVQLGDLGHFGDTGSPTGDQMSYELADEFFDVILWGNHDRAVVSSAHDFRGFRAPSPTVKHKMRLLEAEGRLRMAHSSHGFLFTHAGLHKAFRYQDGVPVDKADPVAVANWINELARSESDDSNHALWDAVSVFRGGKATKGGILWRDAQEKLYGEFRQIFGHTKGDKVRMYQSKHGWSYCLDVGSKTNGRLVGMWLPEEKTVEVKVLPLSSQYNPQPGSYM